ncbi:MAG: tetratricopeptide repeat protein [Desulfopila sp.]|jgi:tetratricopeptide (TPR) repeat protein|nr:tetratricopeptide repeat protein [Desulfopila sp.]
MSNSASLQNINDISPLKGKNGESGVKDPAQVEYEQGKALLERNETGPAAVALHNALLGFEESKNESGIANASNQLGNVCLKRGEYSKALSHFEKAEEICRKLGDPMSLVALAKQFILVYMETEQYKEAVKRCLDLLEIYQANNDPKGTVSILERMAEIYLKSGNTSKAADTYRTIASIHKNFKHRKTAFEFLEKAKELENGA